MSFRRIIKYATVIGITGASVTVLHQNNWDVRNVGLVRFGRAALTVSSIAVDYKFSVSNLRDSSIETLEKWSNAHKRSAERLLHLCCTNGGVFIKVGQHIGALEYLVPKEYCDVLNVLYSRAPRSSITDVQNVIKQDLGKDISQLFVRFDEQPIGAASLAQVHRAELADGRVVAVKVQHPLVKAHSYVDMATMEFLVRLIAYIFPDFSFLWLAEETKKNLPRELDFINEGQNAERLSRMCSKFLWLKVPLIYWNLSSPRILTMEYIEGGEVNDRSYMIKNGISCREISHRLGLLYSEMIFIHGNVHCDPHPGNILIRKRVDGPEIVLLDHGLYTQLTEKFRHQYSRMWLGMINSDIKEIKRWGQELGAGDLYQFLAGILTAKSWQSITTGITKQTDSETRKKEKKELKKYVTEYFQQISEVLRRVDRQLLLVFKTNDLLRAIDFALGTSGERRSILTMSRCCIRAVSYQQLKQCHNVFQRFQVHLNRHYLETRIIFYQIYLWLSALVWGPEYL